MAKGKRQNWYRASVSKGAKVAYIVTGDSVGKVREKLGLLGDKFMISALTWSQLSKLTGCVIPEKYKTDDFAHGNLLFRSGEFCWYLWVDNYMRY